MIYQAAALRLTGIYFRGLLCTVAGDGGGVPLVGGSLSNPDRGETKTVTRPGNDITPPLFPAQSGRYIVGVTNHQHSEPMPHAADGYRSW